MAVAGDREIVGPLDAQENPRFAGLRTYARLPRREDVGPVGIAVMGAPYDGSATYRTGARFGPSAIREASHMLRPYNEPLDFMPFAATQVVDAGDAPTPPMDIGLAHAAVFELAQELTEGGANVLAFGGDHSVSLPLLRAAAARHGKLSLLHFDAHTDTWDEYFGTKVGHGTIFRRAAEEGLIDPSASAQIGLRGPMYSAGDYAENADLGFHSTLARELESLGTENAIANACKVLRSPVYLTVDIDVLDPAFAPGTGTPEGGGVTTRELLAMLRGAAKAKLDIVASDLVEVSPPYDPAGVTAIAAAAVSYELVTLLAMSRVARSAA